MGTIGVGEGIGVAVATGCGCGVAGTVIAVGGGIVGVGNITGSERQAANNHINISKISVFRFNKAFPLSIWQGTPPPADCMQIQKSSNDGRLAGLNLIADWRDGLP